MSTQDQAEETKPAQARHDLAKTLLAGSGLIAAFGVASCCALPIALSLLGISAASLVGVGFLAAAWQRELFYAAVVLLAASGGVAWRQRRAASRNAGAVCRRPALDWATGAAIMLASGLLALTFWIEPPV